MKQNIIQIFSVVFGVVMVITGFIVNDQSFYILGGLFILFPIVLRFKNSIKIPKFGRETFNNPKKINVIKNSGKPFRLFIFCSLILLVSLSILGLFFPPSFEPSKFGLLKYYPQMGVFIAKHWIISVPSVLFLCFIAQFSFNKKKKLAFDISIKKFITLLISFVSSFILSLPLILLFSIIHVSLLGAVSTIKPELVSITTNIGQIKEKIKAETDIPTIIGSDNDARILIVEHSKIFVELSQFYKKNILPSLPKFVFSTIKNPGASVFLYQNYLVIKIIDKDAIQSISPLISKKIVQKYFDTKYIRDEPSVNVISRQDYLKYRDDQFNQKLAEIQSAIDEIKKQIRFVNSKIVEAKSSISTLQGYIVLNSQYRDDEYNKCVSATYTYYGYYSNFTYRVNSDAYCNSLRNNREAQNAGYQSSIDQYNKNLKYYQGQAYNLNENFSDLDSYGKFVEQSKSSTSYELGLFEPPDSVKVVLESTSNKAVGDYFATLTHEYMHYTSYISEERTLPQFFEEGLTEYLSRNAIKESLKISTNLGYPLVTKVIEALSIKIDKSVLSEIYFTKNLDLLTSTLDNIYGKNFYKDTEAFFTLIPYLPSDQALKLANNIMYRIEGPTLTEKDLYSTESSL